MQRIGDLLCSGSDFAPSKSRSRIRSPSQRVTLWSWSHTKAAIRQAISQGSMEETGSPISYNMTSGLGQIIAKKGQAMPFIAFKHFLAIVSLTFGTGAAAMAALPRIAQEPVLGLRYETAKVQFEPLPEEVSSQCKEYANTESWGSRLLVYALIHAGARTYYIVGGYRERLHPAPSESRYEVDDRGGVLSIEGAECTVYGQAREVFDARFFEETPQPILQQLAAAHARTLAQAFGGPDRLRAELRNQRIDADRLSPELLEAFKPYFAR